MKSEIRYLCPNCKGDGQVLSEDTTGLVKCRDCDGSGNDNLAVSVYDDYEGDDEE